jgi:hypothetical protein
LCSLAVHRHDVVRRNKKTSDDFSATLPPTQMHVSNGNDKKIAMMGGR